MKQNTRKRILSFEPLESKCAPSTLLLVLAPMDNSFHQAVEQSRENGGSVLVCPDTNTSSNWQFQFSTTDLLRFVDDETRHVTTDANVGSAPSTEQCRTADEMMKLGDQDLRALVIADSLQVD